MKRMSSSYKDLRSLDPVPVENFQSTESVKVVTKTQENGTKDTYNNWGWLGALILWFIAFIVLFWLIFYSIKPPFVLQSQSGNVDMAKVLLAAVIAALITIVVFWIIWALIKGSKSC